MSNVFTIPIIFGYIWKLSPQLICSQCIWSSIPPKLQTEISNCRHLKIDNITPCQMFSLFQFLFYSIVLSEVAFRLILRRTNNIWVHLETESTTYLFSIYLEWHSAAPNRKYLRHLKIDNIDPFSIFIYYSGFYSTVLSEVAFRLILRRTNNIWVHLETVHNLFEIWSSIPPIQTEISNCRHLKIDNITPCQMFSLFQFLFYSIVLSEVAFRLILRRTNNIWVHLETESTTYLFSIYLEWHSALAPNRKYPMADTWKLIILPHVKCFHYSNSYFTLLSSLRWHSALSSEEQIIFGYIWKLSPQLICSQCIWSSIPPKLQTEISNCRHLKIDNITPCQMFSLFQFLFYSIVLSEVAFRLILRRTNNIWVHLETESTTYLFSIYLEWHSALAPNRKYPIADTWKLIILTPSQFLFTILILILLYCPLWGGIPPYPQKDK